ncbi:MAG TPA: flagellar biosynthesis protein FliQ [Dehalococcoidia bacterium]|nr:flagellar biosynthesis protein FliQ [Dehalococcoidia bacterium]
MSQEFIIALGRDAVTTALLVAAPILGFSLITGLLVSIFQAVTQINEVTLTFVPKILAVFMALALFGPWSMNIMLSFAERLLGNLSMAT